jgi:hypothetical protein
MDAQNRFHTQMTYALVRVDYLILTGVLIALGLYHVDQIRWGAFVAAFTVIDLVGYLPGAIWYYTRPRAERRGIPRVFHVLYNIAHNFGVNALGAGLWYLLEGRWEWAMLALPIHLCGDRGLTGNIYKAFGLSFEPVRHPAFEHFSSEFERTERW